MQIDKLLTEWLAFAKDVQPSCAAGADQLDFLRASTEAELQKLDVSQNSGKPIVSGSLPPDEVALHAADDWFESARFRSDIVADLYSYYEGFRDALKFSEGRRQ